MLVMPGIRAASAWAFAKAGTFGSLSSRLMTSSMSVASRPITSPSVVPEAKGISVSRSAEAWKSVSHWLS